MRAKRVVSILAQTELFAAFEKQRLEEISEFCSPERFPAGSIVFECGHEGDALFIVEDGEIAVTMEGEDERKQEIARYIAGDHFGEMDMMMQIKRNACARAVRDSKVLRFPCRNKSLADLMRVYPSAGARLIHTFIRITAGRIRHANSLLKENSPWVQEMRNQVYRDKLTGLYNKTFLAEQLPSYLGKESLSLLFVKPDNFKEINDTYGHEAGDHALIIAAGALSRRVKEGVLVCRFAGNEMACVFPETNKDAARKEAEDIRSMMNSLDLSSAAGTSGFRLSASIGIAVYPEYTGDAGELIAMAHELPLIGRGRGGNKILFPEDK
jgi:diguanylate cyclase (GGDEF)-like protein